MACLAKVYAILCYLIEEKRSLCYFICYTYVYNATYFSFVTIYNIDIIKKLSFF